MRNRPPVTRSPAGRGLASVSGRFGSGGGGGPTVLSVVVDAAGTSILFTLSEACDAANSQAVGWTLRSAFGDLVGNNGDLAPGDELVNDDEINFSSLSRGIDQTEVLTLEYDPGTGEIVSHATGQEMGDFTGFPVTNNSNLDKVHEIKIITDDGSGGMRMETEAPHGLVNAQQINLIGTTSYDGGSPYTVTVVSPTVVDLAAAFSGDETEGTWELDV